MVKRSALVVSGLIAAFVAADPIAYAYNELRGEPSKQKCEVQLRTLINELNIPGNGESSYNPWTHRCSYRYADPTVKYNPERPDENIRTYQWAPFLR